MYILFQKTGPNLSWGNAKDICEEVVNKGNTNFALELVYGCAGNYCVFNHNLLFGWHTCLEL